MTEYKVVYRSDVHPGGKGDDEAIAAFLNRMAKEGWELMTVEPYGVNTRYYLRKQTCQINWWVDANELMEKL